jgi:tetratricopeptide (TPR) repeat protein
MEAVRSTDRETRCARALSLHEESGDRQAMALDCYQLGTVYQDGGRLDLAITMFRRALVLCEAIRDQQGVAAAYTRLGLLHEMKGDLGQALFFLEEAQSRHDVLGDVRGLAADVGYIGFVHFQQGEYDEAERCYREALALNEQTSSSGKQAEDLANLGNLFSTQGRDEEAEEAYHEALVLYEQVADHRGMGSTYRSLGNMWLQRGDSEQAQHLLELSLQLQRQAGSALGEGLALESLGSICERDGRLEAARDNYEQASLVLEATGHPKHMAQAHGRFGALLLRLDDANRAVGHLESAVALSRQQHDAAGTARWCKRLADAVMKAEGDPKRVQELYDEAMVYFRDNSDLKGEAQVYVGMGNLEARQGKGTQAVAMWTAATERFRQLGVDDQVRNIEVAMKRLWTQGARVA